MENQNNEGCAQPAENTEFYKPIEDKISEDSAPAEMNNTEILKESHFYNNSKDFLLRYTILKEDNKEKIKFDILNTNLISDNMWTYSINVKTFRETVEIKDNNLELYTFLAIYFDMDPPKIKLDVDNNELQLIIKGTSLTLKEEKCEDEIFLNMNIEKKINQLKEKMETKYNEFKKKNEELKKNIEDKKKELEDIKNKNKELSLLNENISKLLTEVEKAQMEAIQQLREVS